VRFTDQQLQALSDFQSWKEGEDGPVTLLDYACYTATPDQLFGYAAVFFRQVIEVDHHYFFADVFDEKAHSAQKAQRPGREIQRSMNELRIAKLLENADVDDVAARSCAQLVANAWNEVHGDKGLVAEVHGTSLGDLVVTLVNGHE
jgi:hypothetical protein